MNDMIRLSQLRPWDRNYNQGDVGAIYQSIAAFGFNGTLRVWRDGIVVAGNHALKALQGMKQAGELPPEHVEVDADGEWLIPVTMVTHLDRTQAQAFAIADNRTRDLATSDDAALAALLQEVANTDAALLAATGYDGDDLDALLAELGGVDNSDADAEPQIDRAEELRQEWGTEPGQLWRLGEHRLICGDCTDAAVVERVMGGEKAAMAFTSPPYADRRKYDESSGFLPIHPDEYCDWFEPVQANVAANLATNGSWFVNIKEHVTDGQRELYVKDLTIRHVRSWGWRFVDEFCWYKKSMPGDWKDRFRNDWEPILHFALSPEFFIDRAGVRVPSKDAFTYRPNSGKTAGGNIGIGKEGRNRMDGLAYPGNVIEISTRKNPNNNSHPAAFPPDLAEWFIRAFCPSGALVLDPFAGSGSLLLAAERVGAVSLGVELSPGYVAVCLQRFQDATGITPELIEN